MSITQFYYTTEIFNLFKEHNASGAVQIFYAHLMLENQIQDKEIVNFDAKTLAEDIDISEKHVYTCVKFLRQIGVLNPEKADPKKPKKLYFIQGASTGRIKIGVSTDIRRRITEMQLSETVEVLLEIDGDEKLESELHNRFKEHQAHGEWFYPSPDILNYVYHVSHSKIKP